MPLPSSERAIQFAISLVMSMVAMTCYNYIDENFMIITSGDSTWFSSSKCSPGYFAHGSQCYPQLGCNDMISDVQVYDEVILGKEIFTELQGTVEADVQDVQFRTHF